MPNKTFAEQLEHYRTVDLVLDAEITAHYGGLKCLALHWCKRQSLPLRSGSLCLAKMAADVMEKIWPHATACDCDIMC